MILVTGAMGRIGTAAAAALQRRGHDVRAFVPSRRRVPWLTEFVREFVERDDEELSLPERDLEGVTAVILLSRPTVEALAAQRRVIDACARVGVPRVVKLSVAGAAAEARSDAARWHWIAEEHLRERISQPIVVRAGRTMQDLLPQSALMRSHHMMVGCQGDGAAADVDTRDVGETLAALAVADGEAAATGEPLHVTGPVALTRPEVARLVGQAMHLHLRYVSCSPLELEQLLVAADITRWQVDDLVAYETAAATGEWQQVTDTVRAVTGREPRSFEAFANEMAHALQYTDEGHSRMAVPSMA